MHAHRHLLVTCNTMSCITASPVSCLFRNAGSRTQVLLSLSRWKTTRPQEWKDIWRFRVKIHPDQVPEEETKESTGHKWMDVRWKNKNTAESLIHSIACDDTRRSDPAEARTISDNKMLALRNSLSSRGFCREQKAYDPPEDVELRVRDAFQDACNLQADSDWINYPLTDSRLKYRFLLLCASKLHHVVPNSDLYLMKTVRDVVHFYKTGIRGSMAYDHLIRIQNRDELPGNLYLLQEPVSYDPNTEFLGGIDAFPGNPSMRYYGIREMIKYPPVKQSIPWPDI